MARTGRSLEIVLGDTNNFRLEFFYCAGPALEAPKVGKQAVPRNAAQPRAKVLADAERVEASPCRDKYVLGDVIGVGDVVELARDVAAQRKFMPSHYLQIQVGFTPLNAFE